MALSRGYCCPMRLLDKIHHIFYNWYDEFWLPSPHTQQYLLANVVGDILLVCSPIYKLRRVKLPQIQRRLIFTCIAGSSLMSLSCFATSAFQIGPASWEPGRGFIKILLGYLEVRSRDLYITLSSLTWQLQFYRAGYRWRYTTFLSW
jgi:hypothetical protein